MHEEKRAIGSECDASGGTMTAVSSYQLLTRSLIMSSLSFSGSSSPSFDGSRGRRESTTGSSALRAMDMGIARPRVGGGLEMTRLAAPAMLVLEAYGFIEHHGGDDGNHACMKVVLLTMLLIVLMMSAVP